MSFTIATSGLNAVTEQLNSVSNNIANSGTVGYKSSRAEFSSLYAQSQPLGTNVSSMSHSISRGGAITSTGNALDLAISGSGFFMVKDSAGAVAYTRAGYFGTDSNGMMVNNQGMTLQGYPVDENGNLKVGTISDLQIKNGAIPAKASDELKFGANLDTRAEVPAVTPFDKDDTGSFNNSYTTKVFDSQGREHTITQYFVKTETNEWTVHYVMDGDIEMDPASQDLKFDTNGKLVSPVGNTTVGSPIEGAEALSLAISYDSMTQFGSEFSVSTNKASGYASGEKTGQQIDDDGRVYAVFSNGERLLQGQVVLANFVNPDGLSPQDGTTWAQTSSSGAALIGAPGSGLMGTVKAGALEGSNVDLTAELVNLMTAQRNYQANTKVISTNDNMLSALFQAV